MDETIRDSLQGWSDYYLITGTAAAALTGLQFVVQSLLASQGHRTMNLADHESGIQAFGTPTVVHFAMALVLSALMCVPWPGFATLRCTLGVLGAGALLYSALVLRTARRQRTYQPVLEDWVWHIVLPALAYAAVLTSALLVGDGEDGPYFALAGATLLLVCIGIHNAWDTVTFLTLESLRALDSAPAAPRRDPPAPPRRAPSVPRRHRRR